MLHGHQRGGETQLQSQVYKDTTVPHPVTLLGVLPQPAANPTAVGLTPQPEGPGGAGLTRGSQEMAISGAEGAEKSRLCEEEREGGHAPESSTDLCNAKSSQGLSELCRWPVPATSQVGKRNFIKALGASLSASALQQSIQREVMKNFSLWPQAQTHNIPRPASVNKAPARPSCPQPLGHRCPRPGPPCTSAPQPSRTANSCFVFPNSYCMGTFICKPALGGPEL